MLVAREAVQMHGAMGITDEADIGLFVRRAMTAAQPQLRSTRALASPACTPARQTLAAAST